MLNSYLPAHMLGFHVKSFYKNVFQWFVIFTSRITIIQILLWITHFSSNLHLKPTELYLNKEFGSLNPIIMLNTFTFTCFFFTLKHVIYLNRLSRVLELPLRPSKMDGIEVHLTCTCRDVHFRFSAVNDLPKLNKVTNIFLISLSMTLCFVISLIFMDVRYISLLITV